MRRHDLRIWGRATLDDGAHEFYARGLLSAVDFNSGNAMNIDLNGSTDAQGDPAAREFYRKALYLDPNHYESLLQMALWAEREGDAEDFEDVHLEDFDSEDIRLPIDHQAARAGQST